MKINLLALLLASFSLFSCGSSEIGRPEPHLELGQRLIFVGAEPEKTYVVVGYRHLLEDKTDKNWSNQDYIVVSYSTDEGEMKVAAIHKNAVLKK